MNDEIGDEAQHIATQGEWYLMRAAQDGQLSVAFEQAEDKRKAWEERVYQEHLAEARAYEDAWHAERDRRIVWMSAIQGALSHPSMASSDHAAEVADSALAEYDKRWP